MNREQGLRRIVVFGHVGQRNLGDEAAYRAVIEAARARIPGVEFLGVSVDPMSTARDFGIPVLPIWRGGVSDDDGSPDRLYASDRFDVVATSGGQQSRSARVRPLIRRLPGLAPLMRALRAAGGAVAGLPGEIAFAVKGIKAMRGADLFVIAGSQHLNDYVLGPWNFPFTVFKWCLMARLAGARVALASVGAGPVRTWLGRCLVRATIALSYHVSFRDESSVECVRGLGTRVAGPPRPDLVFSLKADCASLPGAPVTGRPVIGINAIPFSSADYWIGGGEGPYKRYLQILADFTGWLCGRGYDVQYFPTQLTLDPRVIDDLESLLPADLRSSGQVRRASITSLEDLEAAIAGMHAVVASRFHGLVFAAARRRPVIGIAYAVKTRDLLEYMGVGEMAVDIETLDTDVLQARFRTMEARYEDIVNVLADRLTSARKQLADLFDSLFGAEVDASPAIRPEKRREP